MAGLSDYQLDEYGKPRMGQNEGGSSGYYLKDGTLTWDTPEPTFNYDAFSGTVKPTYDASGTWTISAMKDAISKYGYAPDVDMSSYNIYEQNKSYDNMAKALGQSMQYNEWKNYYDSLQPWQQTAFNQTGSNYHDPYYRNVRFLDSGSIIKSEFGGSGATGAQYVANNPESDLWYGSYNPQTGDVKDWTYQEGIKTTGNEFAPAFVGLGTLLTGGMLAPLAIGAGGIMGGAAFGAGLGASSAALNSQLSPSGFDIGKVAMGGIMGGIGGGISAGMGGASMFGPGEFAMSPETALAYGMEQYPSGWEGSIYGSEQGLLDATGSVADWAGGYSFGDFESEADWANYWEDYEDIPMELDVAAENITGSKLTDIAKKMGMDAAKSVAKQLVGTLMAPSGSGNAGAAGAVGTGTGAGLLASNFGKAPQLSASSSLPEIQQVGAAIGVPVSEKEAKKLKTEFLKYDLSNDTLTPDYWRFMSDAEEGI